MCCEYVCVTDVTVLQDWASFFDTVCYEIGSDVFSLSEIEHCVLGTCYCFAYVFVCLLVLFL